jgi:diguanylate cyclase (GGDEF)-like protein
MTPAAASAAARQDPARPADLDARRLAGVLAGAFDAADILLVVLDRQGHVVHVNEAGAALACPPPPDSIGLPLWEVFACPSCEGPDEPRGTLAAFRAAIAASGGARRGPAGVEQLYVGPLGDRRRLAWTFAPLRDPHGEFVVGVAADVSEHRMAEATWRQLAQTDSLTGLANRVVLRAALADHLHPERGLGCGLLFCDLDGFKQINDTRGHAIGDQVLTHTAQRLLDSVRHGDLVARLGGDEFVIVMPAAGAIETRAAATRVERAVSRPLRLDVGTVRVGVSVGHRVADTGEDPDAVLSDADHAMYAVKSRRNHARSSTA